MLLFGNTVILSDPPLDTMRAELVEYGVGFQKPMDLLLIAPAALGNAILAEFFVTRLTPNIAIELLRDPYGSNIFGVKIQQPLAFIRKYASHALEEPCRLDLFTGFAEQWFLEEGKKDFDSQKLLEAYEVNAMAHLFANKVGMLPEKVQARMQEAYRKK